MGARSRGNGADARFATVRDERKHPIMTRIPRLRHACALTLLAGAAQAHGITAAPGTAALADFDIVAASVTTEGRIATFTMSVAGTPGATRPEPAGGLAGAPVYSYVWPTTLDPSVVGFAEGAGILAFAVTIHPDFDDTPLFDEDASGSADDDGGTWHSHWVVLGPDDACGAGALKVIDIPEGETPPLPLTWPGLPILIDSPGWSPTLKGRTVEVRVPFDDIGAVEAGAFDGVTAALRVNASVHSPLLCVVNVFKVASGDLSLPGKVNR